MWQEVQFRSSLNLDETVYIDYLRPVEELDVHEAPVKPWVLQTTLYYGMAKKLTHGEQIALKPTVGDRKKQSIKQ